MLKNLRRLLCGESGPPSGLVQWSDEPSLELNDKAAQTITARVFPAAKKPTEIVLEGSCPRCGHRTASTHPLRSVMTLEELAEQAESEGIVLLEDRRLRHVTAQCRCGHDHPSHPEGERNCGAPYAVWVSWPIAGSAADQRIAEVHPSKSLSVLELEEERDLQAAAEQQLAGIRKAAENWRTGLAGLLAVLTAVFFIKGKESFDDIGGDWWKAALAALLLLAAVSAIFGAYRAIRAAYGAPRDEYVGRASFRFANLPKLLRTTPDEIERYGSLSAWRHAFAVQAVIDLWWAKVATVFSLTLIVAAAVVTWLAPGPPPAAFVRATYADGDTQITVCGDLLRAREPTVAIEVAKEDIRRFRLSNLVSLEVVESCQS